jgi:beta-glucosidase
LNKSIVASVIVVVLGSTTALAQQSAPEYLSPQLPAEVRAKDLVGRMTLEEKASQMTNQARAIPRLGLKAYDWWSESLHGVIADGNTEFPEPIGLAATFDPAAIGTMAHSIAIEGRIHHAKADSEGHSNIHEGLDFWAPNINIFRDPRWGRGQETYGEDPFLTARMGVSYIKGLQGDDPHYFLAIATPKHFAVHSGPEPSRHGDDVTVSKHDELDTYLPAFRAAVTEGHAGSVMCAYNSINGQPACANEFLLEDQLRGKWGFRGYVVSDCAAVVDIFKNHHFTPTQPEASAIAVQRGMDNECTDYIKVTDDHDYHAYIDAVKLGVLKEAELDRSLIRTLTARFKLGLLDPPDMVKFNHNDPALMGGTAHRALARELGNESMVLLKNDGLLPLRRTGTKIAVIGPLADETRVLLGNYNGTPTHTVSALEGMRAEFGAANVSFTPGTTFLDDRSTPLPADALEKRIKVTYTFKRTQGGEHERSASGPEVDGIDPSTLTVPAAGAGERLTMIRWEGQLVAPVGGTYNLGLESHGPALLSVDGRHITRTPGWETFARLGSAQLQANRPTHYSIDYEVPEDGGPRQLRFVWVKPAPQMQEAALTAAHAADVVVAVVGITSMLEGEEMEVSEAGFKGGDRTSLDLPQPERELVQALAKTGKPLILVLTNGSALSVEKESRAANAVIEAFYPGEEGGTAIAQTLSGRNNPSGRLPVTFYQDVAQLPPFGDYAMTHRTYRYFDGKPLYPFGYGLSYTQFSYGTLSLPKRVIHAGEPLIAEVALSNSGKLAGDEVAQAYLNFPPVDGAPRVALRGFQRVHLNAGETRTLRFKLSPRDLSMVTSEGRIQVAAGEYTLSVGGGQPGFTQGVSAQKFSVSGTQQLSE